jgi:Xaa-Pro aminopeptidase
MLLDLEYWSQKRLDLWATDQVLVTLPFERPRICPRPAMAAATFHESQLSVSMNRFFSRREKLRVKLTSDDIDALLVSAPSNVSYLTGFSGDSSVLILGRDRDLLVSDGRFTTQLEQECPGLEAHIRAPGQEMNPVLAQIMQALGLHRIALEATSWTIAEYEAIRAAAPTLSFQGVAGRVEALRQIKDDDEIAAIRESVRFAERAFTMLRAGLRLGESEKDVADTLEAYLRRCGATGASFPPIVAVGVRSALPHARPTPTTKIGADDFVLIDWGATGHPYKSDLTRILVTGMVTSTFETVYRTVLTAQERGIAAIRPGVKAHDVDAEARSVIENAGFGQFFDHGLGHGIGMDIHEAPRLRKASNVTLEPGMVITVEPGVYLPDWGGIRIEDDVLVTPNGCEVLSHVPKSLDSVRIET